MTSLTFLTLFASSECVLLSVPSAAVGGNCTDNKRHSCTNYCLFCFIYWSVFFFLSAWLETNVSDKWLYCGTRQEKNQIYSIRPRIIHILVNIREKKIELKNKTKQKNMVKGKRYKTRHARREQGVSVSDKIPISCHHTAVRKQNKTPKAEMLTSQKNKPFINTWINKPNYCDVESSLPEGAGRWRGRGEVVRRLRYGSEGKCWFVSPVKGRERFTC